MLEVVCKVTVQRDEQRCFEAAGLLEALISEATVARWGRTSDMARMLNDGFFNEQGSAAEKLRLECETKRMAKLDLVCQAKGNLPADRMESKHVRRLRDELEKGAANQRLKALKALFTWAVEAE